MPALDQDRELEDQGLDAYDEYEENRRKRLGETAAQPHRIKFKPLARAT